MAGGEAASLLVTWNRNTESDLAGYIVSYGTRAGTFSNSVDVHNVTSYRISNVQNGVTYYVAVSAYDTSGNVSPRSDVCSVNVPAVTIPQDTSPPTGSVSINAGAASTSSNRVTLTLSARDAAGSVTGMKVSNDGVTYCAEMAYAASCAWTLLGGYGTRTVYVLFKDSAGNWSSTPAVDTIMLVETAAPTSSVAIDTGSSGASDPSSPAGNDAGQGTDGQVKPVVISPANNASGVPLMPVIETTSPPDGFDRAEWEISSEDGDLVLDLKTCSDPAEFSVPDLVLDAGVTYYCRVRFLDGRGNSTAWSDPSSFRTVDIDSADLNVNGIPDQQELSPFDGIDLDRNGVADRVQADMRSLISFTGETYLGVKMSTNCRAIRKFMSIDPASIAKTGDMPAHLPIGLIDFKLEVERPGDFAELIVHLSEPAPAGSRWYVYSATDGWSEYPYATFSADRTEVTLRLKDGDVACGDSDGVANGIILDPGGIGVGEDAATADTRDDAGGTGCFVSSTAADRTPFAGMAGAILLLTILCLDTLFGRRRHTGSD